MSTANSKRQWPMWVGAVAKSDGDHVTAVNKDGSVFVEIVFNARGEVVSTGPTFTGTYPHWQEQARRVRDTFRGPAPRTPISFRSYILPDSTKLKRRQFLYGKHFIRRYASATIATSGVGKSSLVLVEALALATGRNLLGVEPEERCRVAIWNGEDPFDELDRRISAIARRYSISAADLNGCLFVESGRQMPITLGSLVSKLGATIDEQVLQDIVADLKAKRVDVLIIDPFVSSHRVPENDNNGMDAIVKAWCRIAELADCAIELVHHSKKTYGEEVSVEDSRGASAVMAAVRSARTINTMTKAEADQAGVKNRRLYFKCENGKSNMGPPPADADWFELSPESLGNNTLLAGAGDNSDMVAVVVPWTWPDLLAAVTPEHAMRILAEVRAGEWKDSPRSPDWVGRAVAKVLGLDLKATRDNAVVKAWIKEALATGSLVKETRKDEKTRKERVFIVVGGDE